jgi:chromosomal replication initiation ATPase DnaA
MSKNPEQLLLDLPHRVAFGRDDFLVTRSNEAVVALVDQWPNWPSHAAIIVGPEGSGKSHLTAVWCGASKAIVTNAAALNADDIPQLLQSGAAAIEDIDDPVVNERALFHAINLAKQEGKFLLLTSKVNPQNITLKIPDLSSRLKALPVIEILPADDALLRGVLVKLFADRQIAVEEGLISYILLRMPRALATARKLVADVDKLALTEKADVTKPLVARILAQMESPDLFT